MSPAPTCLAVIAAVCIAPYAHASPPFDTPQGLIPSVIDVAQADPGSTAPDPEDEADAVEDQPDVTGSLAESNQSAMATPDAFRFAGSMASIWTPQMAASINQDIHVTLPLMVHPQEYFDEGTYVWDAWPIRNPDGSITEFDGWVVMVALSSTWNEVEESGHAFYTLSELRYWYTRDGNWRPGGTIFARAEGLGSRQWAGSAVYDSDADEVTLYYTAVGNPDAPSLDEDPAPGPISIFNEAIGRPSTVQRLATATATVAVTDDGVAFENVGNHRIIGEADGFWYDTYDTYLSGEAAYGFRDPEYFRNPLTGEDHILFTGNAGGVPGPYNGSVGLMTRNDAGDWDLEAPILISAGVNSQLERPHVVLREDGLYLFFSTHDFTFSPELAGPRGLYGFRAASGDIRGRLQPLNGHGLVAANPLNAPAQVYSYLVLPDGRVMSYLNILWGFAQRPEYAELEMFGAPAPMFQVLLDGNTATVATQGSDADR